METLAEILFTVSSALLIPVVAALLAMLLWCLLELGGFIREMVDRGHGKVAWRDTYEAVTTSLASDEHRVGFPELFGHPIWPGFLGEFSSRGERWKHNLVLLHKLAGDLEIEVAGRIARMTSAVRLGPTLGLMGTLIPLGPALVGLASGDIQQLGQSLVVAFSTTVVGLAVGGFGYSIGSARRRWYAWDMSNIEFIIQCLEHENRGDTVGQDE
jgi:biopolymer transport protein ExbB/TolQ